MSDSSEQKISAPSVKIPYEALSAQALEGVIDEFVMREGTDYGHADYPLEKRRERVLAQLRAGTAEIWFDPASETTTLRLADS